VDVDPGVPVDASEVPAELVVDVSPVTGDELPVVWVVPKQ
jgi:hypothetical protein